MPGARTRHGRPLQRSRRARSFLLVKRTAWDIVVNVVASSPFLPAPARCLIYRLVGFRIATWNIRAGCWFTGRSVVLGRDAFVNYGCFFDELGTISIGDRCQIGQQVSFVGSGHAIGPRDERAGAITAAPIRIGDGVWIGARAVILAGATIGDGCVVAAGAVVTGDCPSDGLYAGVPARRIRDLPP